MSISPRERQLLEVFFLPQNPSECYTPAAYGGEDKASDTGHETSEYTQTVKDPVVIGTSFNKEEEAKQSKK